MKIDIYRMVLFAVGVGLGAPAWSADKFPCPQAPISLAFYEAGALYNEGKGLDVDVFEALRKRTGCTFQTSERPRARIWMEMEAGQLDMATSAISTQAREQFAHFVYYMRQKNMVLAGKTLPTDIVSPEQFLANPALKWGAIRSYKHGVSYDAFVDQLRASGRSPEAKDSPELLRMLKLDMFAATLSIPLVYRYVLTDADLKAIRVMDWKKNEGDIPYALIFSRAKFSEPEIQRWREVVDDMTRDGTMLKLLSKYLPPVEAHAALLK